MILIKVFMKMDYHYLKSSIILLLFLLCRGYRKRYSDFMTWDQIKEASKYGEISLHSFAHKHLTHLSNEEIIDDTKKSYDIFVNKLGFKPKGYVYPYGEYDQRVKTQIKSFGFDYIANQSSGSVNHKSDVYDLNRVALVGKVNLKQKLKIQNIRCSMDRTKGLSSRWYFKRVKVKVDPNIKNIKLYLSTYGWQDIKVKMV